MKKLLRISVHFTLLLCSHIPAAYAQDYTTGLVGYWKLDETSGTSAAESVSGYTGTMSGGLTATTDSLRGMQGRALDLDGVWDVITAGDILPLNGQQSFTLSTWVNFDNDPMVDTDFMIERRDNYWLWWNGDNQLLAGTDNRLIFGYDQGATNYDYSVAWTPTAGQWYLVTGVHDATTDTATIYVNGTALGTQATNASGSLVTTAGRNLYIGQRVAGFYNLGGYMDDVRVYNRALSAADVAALYANTLSTFTCLNPVGVTGEMFFNTNHRTMQYCNSSVWVAMGKPASYIPPSVTFSSGAYLYHSSGLNIANGRTISGSFWVRRNTINNDVVLYGSVTNIFTSYFYIGILANNSIEILDRVGGVNRLRVSSATKIADTNWHHVAFSFDMDNAANRHIVIDGVPSALNVTNYVLNQDLTLTHTQAYFGGAWIWNQLDGDVADFWLDAGAYIDLSQSANVERFMRDGNPVYLGTDGSIATGTAPDLFLSGTATTITLDKGAAPTETLSINGTIRDGSIAPSINDTIGDITTGLLGHWKLDETSGTTAAESVSGTYNATMNGGMTGAANTVAGKDGTALYFDGVNNSISTGSGINLGGSNQATMSVWVKEVTATPPGFRGILYKANSVFEIYTDSAGRILVFIANNSAFHNAVTSPAYTDWDTWHHIAATYDGANVRIYRDGVQVAISGAETGNLSSSTNTFFIGVLHSGALWRGSMDDVRLYSRALSANDIQALYNAGNGYTCISPDGKTGSIVYNTTHHVMQYCDGNRWVAMNKAGNGGGGCSNPSGVAGTMIYNSAMNFMQYCEGDQWMAAGGSADPLLIGLLAHWKLNETSGSAIADSSGNGQNATWTDGGDNVISGGDLQATAPDGAGLNFNGNNSNFITHTSRLGDPTNLTLAGWVNISSLDTTGSTLINIGGRVVIEFFSDRVEGSYEAPGAVWRRTSYNNDILGDGWTHVVWTHDDVNNTQVLYINGIPVANSAYTESINWTSANANTYIAKHVSSNAYHLIGSMDDVRVYNRVLTAGEVSDLYNSY